MQLTHWLYPGSGLLGIYPTEALAGSRVFFPNGYGVSWYMRNPRKRDTEEETQICNTVSICIVKGTEDCHNSVTDDITIDAEDLGNFLSFVSNPFFKYFNNCKDEHEDAMITAVKGGA